MGTAGAAGAAGVAAGAPALGTAGASSVTTLSMTLGTAPPELAAGARIEVVGTWLRARSARVMLVPKKAIARIEVARVEFWDRKAGRMREL